jgi:hypothetical protein
MTQQLSNVFIEQFESEVKVAYQNGSLLMGKNRHKSGIVGTSTNFPKYGKMGSSPRGASSSLVVPNGVDISRVNCLIKDWTVRDDIDDFDQMKTNVQERQYLTSSIGMAIGRRHDQVIIDELAATSVAPSFTNIIQDGGTNLTVDKLTRAAEILTNNGVPSGKRTLIMSASGLRSLLNQEKIGNIDYNVLKPLYDGKVVHYMGMDIVVIEDRPLEGGLPISTNIRSCFVYDYQAIGTADNGSPKIDTQYYLRDLSTTVLGKLTIGAKTIDQDGIVEIKIDETA